MTSCSFLALHIMLLPFQFRLHYWFFVSLSCLTSVLLSISAGCQDHLMTQILGNVDGFPNNKHLHSCINKDGNKSTRMATTTALVQPICTILAAAAAAAKSKSYAIIIIVTSTSWYYWNYISTERESVITLQNSRCIPINSIMTWRDCSSNNTRKHHAICGCNIPISNKYCYICHNTNNNNHNFWSRTLHNKHINYQSNQKGQQIWGWWQETKAKEDKEEEEKKAKKKWSQKTMSSSSTLSMSSDSDSDSDSDSGTFQKASTKMRSSSKTASNQSQHQSQQAEDQQVQQQADHKATAQSQSNITQQQQNL